MTPCKYTKQSAASPHTRPLPRPASNPFFQAVLPILFSGEDQKKSDFVFKDNKMSLALRS